MMFGRRGGRRTEHECSRDDMDPDVCALWALGVTASSAQEPGTEVPRTSWGAPDLQGVWDFRSLTPMERPDELSDEEVLTAEQAAAFAADEIGRRSRDSETSDRA